LEDLKW